jgi:hypothetical protein
MSKKEIAIEGGLGIIHGVRDLMSRVKKDLLSKDEDIQAQALILLKALDAFLSEESGLSLWANKVRICIAEHIERTKNFH